MFVQVCQVWQDPQTRHLLCSVLTSYRGQSVENQLQILAVAGSLGWNVMADIADGVVEMPAGTVV